MATRARAALALKEHARHPQVLEALAARLADDKEFWWVQEAAAQTLGAHGGQRACELLRKSASTPHALPRTEVAEALGACRDRDTTRLLVRMLEGDRSYHVAAAAARSLGQMEDPRAERALVRALSVSSWEDLVAKGALQGLAATRNPVVLGVISKAMRPPHSLNVREAAMGAVASLARGPHVTDSERDHLRRELERILHHELERIQWTAVAALETLGEPGASGALESLAVRAYDGDLQRKARRVAHALRTSPRRGAVPNDVAQDLRELVDKNRELRDRLAELERRLETLLDSRDPKKSDDDAQQGE